MPGQVKRTRPKWRYGNPDEFSNRLDTCLLILLKGGMRVNPFPEALFSQSWVIIHGSPLEDVDCMARYMRALTMSSQLAGEYVEVNYCDESYHPGEYDGNE